MSEWIQGTLADLAFFQRGFDITKSEQEDGFVPVVSSSGVQSYHSKAMASGPGVLIGRKGTLGSVHFVAEDYWPHDTTLWVKDFKGNNPRFVYYFLKTLTLETFDSGGANPTLNRNHIHDLKIRIPPHDTQTRIAAILSTYDDLIENNTRRIALLEESMRLLYREWFVRLRFPGYERVKVVDGLPEGWERTIIDQAFDVLGGGTPSKEMNEYWENGTINWYTPTDLTKAQTMFAEESLNKINDVGLANSSAKMFPPNSVMMTSRATIGVIAINTTDACTNQGFITCLPNERVPLYFLHHWLKDNVDVFISHATGATFKEITKGVFRQLPIVLPERRVLKEFEDAVKPMAECVLNLQRQNRLLIEARDLLLPRLMSESISV